MAPKDFYWRFCFQAFMTCEHPSRANEERRIVFLRENDTNRDGQSQGLIPIENFSLSRSGRYAHLSPAVLKGATDKLDVAFTGLLSEPDGTQMRTNERETVSTPVHSCPSDENIQAFENAEVKELCA